VLSKVVGPALFEHSKLLAAADEARIEQVEQSRLGHGVVCENLEGGATVAATKALGFEDVDLEGGVLFHGFNITYPVRFVN